MNNYLVVTALGADQPNIVNRFTQSITSCGGNILNTRMTTLGNEFAIMLLIEGDWSAIAKIETTLPSIEQKLGLVSQLRRTTPRDPIAKTMPYLIQVVTIDRGGIINDLTQFFASQDINITDISAHAYNSQAGTKMMTLSLQVSIDVELHIPSLRDRFTLYCDALNLDASLEPCNP